FNGNNDDDDEREYYAPSSCLDADGDDDDDGDYDYAPAASLEGDDNDDGGYDFAPAAYGRPSNPLERYYVYMINSEGRDIGDHEELETYLEAMLGSESYKWIEVMSAEM
ncbi:hypothetical protein Tco_1442917, partial [Tanacetum coccineum]